MSDVTYYDVPVLKAPVWKWFIPAYFVAGGIAGASSTLGAAARDLPGLRRRCRRLSLVALSVGTAALIADLGRPSRFANMLRVFRPTSPMSMGSWLLAAYGPAAGAAAVLPDKIADPAGIVAGIAGLPLTGYTGVLTAATAVPAWQEAGRSLPVLFTASGIAGAASLLALGDQNDQEAAVLRRFGIAGKVGELAASAALEREVGAVPAVARPYKEGRSALLWRLAHGCTTISLLLSLPRKRARRREQAGALAGIAGSFLVKVAVMEAGKASADDPRATFHLQRARNSDSLDNR
jgi:formate-dependent nitrite reductase membrane component NrfD